MPTYIILERLTPQGLNSAKAMVKRAQESRYQHEAHGFHVLGTYWTHGHYDMVTLVRAPTEESMMAAAINIAENGNVQLEVLRAFSEEEMVGILAPAE
jgi:uncharacterized protein with GYD domain